MLTQHLSMKKLSKLLLASAFASIHIAPSNGGRILLADAPAPGANNTWPYGSCYFLVQDIDLKLEREDANIDNTPSSGPEDCFLQCQQSLVTWKDDKQGDLEEIKQDGTSDPVKVLELFLTMKSACGQWTFVPGSGEEGRCFLKQGANFELLQATIDLANNPTEAEYNEFVSKYSSASFSQYSYEPVTDAEGWFTGFMYAEIESYYGTAYLPEEQTTLENQFDYWFSTVRSVPNPDGLVCTEARADTFYCQKVLASLKGPAPPPPSLYDSIINRPPWAIPPLDYDFLDAPSRSPARFPEVPSG